MKAIFEFFKEIITIEFLLIMFIILLLGWIVIAWQDYKENKDVAKRLDEENEFFKEKHGRSKKRRNC